MSTNRRLHAGLTVTLAAALSALLRYSVLEFVPGSLQTGGPTVANFTGIMSRQYLGAVWDTVLLSAAALAWSAWRHDATPGDQQRLPARAEHRRQRRRQQDDEGSDQRDRRRHGDHDRHGDALHEGAGLGEAELELETDQAPQARGQRLGAA